MSNQITLTVDLLDFDRSLNLPVSVLFAWAQKCRLPVYFSGPFAKLRESVGTMMVKAQTFEFCPDVPPPTFLKEIVVQQYVATVGRTSITLSLSFKEKDVQEKDVQEFAHGTVVMVCVSEGKAKEIPRELAEELLSNRSAPNAEAITTLKEMLERKAKEIRETSDQKTVIIKHPVLLRSSDEDTNKHVRHVKYAQFFEDAIQENVHELHSDDSQSTPISPIFQFLSVEYIKETRKGESCEVQVVTRTKKQLDERGDAFAFTMLRGKEAEVVCRGVAKF